MKVIVADERGIEDVGHKSFQALLNISFERI